MYTLHYWPDTASLIVRLVAEEMGVAHEARLIDREAGALNAPEYRALHPLGLIPAFETPDGPMFETAAILLYLSERHGLAPAPGSADRAAFLKWLFFTSTNIHPTLLQMFYPDRTAGAENSAAVVTHAKARMAEYLTILDQAAAPNPDWLSHSQPTVLGYYIAVLMRWIAGDFPPAQYPALFKVLTYLETRPATRAAAQAENLGPHPFTQG
jgi:glutathione S-transferase